MATKISSIAHLAEKTGRLVSRLGHPVTVQYGTSSIRLSPRSTSLPLTLRLLGTLPQGVSAVPQS